SDPRGGRGRGQAGPPPPPASAQQANTYADEAEASARNAQASADQAKQAAATARTAARSANYSASQALKSARNARISADSAKEQATLAHTSAVQAGRSAIEAATAASEARLEASIKRGLEDTATAEFEANRQAAAESTKTNPADTPEHDTVKLGLSKSEWQHWSHTTHEWAFYTGVGAIAAGVAGVAVGFTPLAPGAPVLLATAGILNIASVGLDLVSAFCAGMGYGWTSNEFQTSAGLAVFSLLSFGFARNLKYIPGVSHAVGELTALAVDGWTSILNRMTAH
ncbi:hypothetical protein ABZY44_23210, partial [Streptomyces sp. NPDC006544]